MKEDINFRLSEYELRLLREWVNKRCRAGGYYHSVDLQVFRILNKLDDQLNADPEAPIVDTTPEETI